MDNKKSDLESRIELKLIYIAVFLCFVTLFLVAIYVITEVIPNLHYFKNFFFISFNISGFSIAGCLLLVFILRVITGKD